MNRHTHPKHIVAAGALISKRDHYLLIRNPRRGWEFPGGQIEEGESLIDGVIREVKEETNADVTITQMAAVYSNLTAPSKVLFDFVGEWVSGELQPSEESPEVAWLTQEEALAQITHVGYLNRIQHLFAFDGEVRYQSYTTTSGHQIREERAI